MYRRYSSAPVGGNTDSHKPEVSGAPRHGGGFDRSGQKPNNGASFGNPHGSCGDSLRQNVRRTQAAALPRE